MLNSRARKRKSKPSEQINSITSASDLLTSNFDRPELREHLAKLRGGVAIKGGGSLTSSLTRRFPSWQSPLSRNHWYCPASYHSHLCCCARLAILVYPPLKPPKSSSSIHNLQIGQYPVRSLWPPSNSRRLSWRRCIRSFIVRPAWDQ